MGIDPIPTFYQVFNDIVAHMYKMGFKSDIFSLIMSRTYFQIPPNLYVLEMAIEGHSLSRINLMLTFLGLASLLRKERKKEKSMKRKQVEGWWGRSVSTTSRAVLQKKPLRSIS